MAADDYLSIHLSDAAPSVISLMDKAAEESRQSIILTSARQMFGAAQPGCLTPAMSEWYSRNVAGPRSAALGALSAAFAGDAASDSQAKSIFLEASRDGARTKHVVQAIAEANRFIDKNGPILHEFDERKGAYETLRAQLNREPTMTKTWIYVLGLLAVLLLEAFINFESFLKVPYITSPFLATGATLAVALGVGGAAHASAT